VDAGSAGGRSKVLSIVGPGRSGTTILASILGEVPGVVSAGEIRWLWQRGVLEQRSCGCSRPPTQCPLWSVVLDRVLGMDFAGDERGLPALRAILGAQAEVALLRNRLRVIRRAARTGATWPAFDRMHRVTATVCSTLVEQTQAKVIVETSKRAQEAAVFASLDSVDHYVLHIVRDPRAVAYSWRRRKPAGPGSEHRTMSPRRLVPSVTRWTENSVGAELLRRQLPNDRWLFVRYEDLVAEPRGTVDRVLAFLDLEPTSPFDDERTVTLGPNHIVAGNPSRFRHGPVRIVADNEWQQQMSKWDQLCVAGLALPLLLRYGYPTRMPGTGKPAAAR